MADPRSEDLEDIFFGSRSTGDQPNLEVLMEQCKLFVETSERLVARRQVVNTFFLSVNALALSALGLIAKEASQSPLIAIGIVAISVAAIVLCIEDLHRHLRVDGVSHGGVAVRTTPVAADVESLLPRAEPFHTPLHLSRHLSRRSRQHPNVAKCTPSRYYRTPTFPQGMATMPSARTASRARIADLTRFYTILNRSRQRVGGTRLRIAAITGGRSFAFWSERRFGAHE